MIKYIIQLCIVIMFFLVVSCQKEGGSDVIESKNISGSGIEFFPVESNKTVKIIATGSQIEYESDGKIVSMQNVSNQTYSGYIGTTAIVNGLIANQVYGIDQNNRAKLAGYIYNNSGEVVALDGSSKGKLVTLFPKDLAVGREWIVNPSDNQNRLFKAKVVEGFSNYTNGAGKNFQNVLNIFVGYKDSVIVKDSYTTSFSKLIIDANIYLAKNIGVVDIKLKNHEAEDKYSYTFMGFNYSSYKKIKTNGVISLIE